MDIRGLNPFTLLDYPGLIACVLFTGGCNFRCGFCHNPYLVLWPESQPATTADDALAFLRGRVGLLEAVVVSGGEPTLQADLPDFLAQVKALGFKVRLDTNGAAPARLAACLERGLLDGVGIDYKAPAARYPEVSCTPLPDVAARVHASIRAVRAAGCPLEIRTTVHRLLHPPADLRQMRAELTALGIGAWVLQQFHPAEVIDPALAQVPTYSDAELVALAAALGETTARGLGAPLVPPTRPETLASA